MTENLLFVWGSVVEVSSDTV